MSTITSRVFMNGNSQAIRIPHELRLDTTQVEICRTPEGDLLIHPLPATAIDRGQALMAALKGFDADFIQHLADSRDQEPPQEREAL